MDGPKILRPIPDRADSQTAQARYGFALFVGLLLLVAAGKAVLFDSLDPDSFWHLKVANVLAQQSFPQPIIDDLSFDSVRHPWTPYSWLAELAMKVVWDAGGIRGAVAAHALMSATLVLFTVLAALEGCVAKHGTPRYLLCGVLGAAAEFLALPFVSFRPVTLAMAMLAIINWLIQRDRRMEEKSRLVWLIVPLTALLANVHLFVIFSPMLMAAFFIGACIDKTKPSLRRYGLLLGLTCAASLLTPMLPGMIETSLRFATSDIMVHSPIIAELQPFYKGSTGPVTIGFVLAAIGCGLWRRNLMRPADWVLLTFCLIFLFKLGRFAPLFAVFTAPMLAACAPRLSDKALGNRAVAIALATLALICWVRIVRAFPARDETLDQWLERLGPDCPGYPTAGCDFVDWAVVPKTHRLIDEFTWGGYLEWRLGNQYQVLIDGRTQLFSDDVWKALYLGTPQERKAYLATIKADVAVLPVKDSAFAKDLLDLGWMVIYQDARAQVLVPISTRK